MRILGDNSRTVLLNNRLKNCRMRFSGYVLTTIKFNFTNLRIVFQESWNENGFPWITHIYYIEKVNIKLKPEDVSKCFICQLSIRHSKYLKRIFETKSRFSWSMYPNIDVSFPLFILEYLHQCPNRHRHDMTLILPTITNSKIHYFIILNNGLKNSRKILG